MSLSPRNLILLGLGAILLIAIPLTVFLVQRQQQTQSNANPASRLSFEPASTTAGLGETVSLDVKIDPGQGDEKNLVGEMQLTITYDAEKLELTDTKFTPNQAIFPVSTEPDYSPVVGGFATISAALSAGTCTDVTCEISALTSIATIKFKTIAVTGDTPAKVTFDSTKTLVLSAGTGESAGENVLLSAGEANITVTEEGEPEATPTTVTPTVTTTATPTITVAPTTTITVTPGAGGANQIPVCSGLVLDKAASGTAPYELSFTATGTDSDGTISKVSFSFGDGTIQDVTEGGGIATNSVNSQITHTYSTAGTFTASVTLTDELDGVSDSATCTQTITVTAAGGTTTTPGGTTTEPPPAAVATATPIPTLAPTGPTETLIGIGILGIIFTILGAAVLLIF